MRIMIIGMMAILVCGAAGIVNAQESGTGVGVILGEPTGLNVKNWTTERTAVAAAIAWAFDPNTSFHVHGDYLFHDYTMIAVEKGRLPLYTGIGARFKFDDQRGRRGRGSRTRMGVRIPLGVNYHFAQAPVDLFFELVPILDVAPRSDVSLNGAIGARFFFR